MANNLDNFINEFNGGNRTHRYDVEMRFPGAGTGFDDSLNRFFIRAVSLPPSQVNPIRIPYRGRILKWPGDRIYFPWTFRVLDQGGKESLWTKFNDWSNTINDHKTNINNPDWDNFTTDWKIQQIGANGNTVLKEVTLFDCWPTIIGPISMDANSIDTLVEFTVTVEYSYHTVKDVN